MALTPRRRTGRVAAPRAVAEPSLVGPGSCGASIPWSDRRTPAGARPPLRRGTPRRRRRLPHQHDAGVRRGSQDAPRQPHGVRQGRQRLQQASQPSRLDPEDRILERQPGAALARRAHRGRRERVETNPGPAVEQERREQVAVFTLHLAGQAMAVGRSRHTHYDTGYGPRNRSPSARRRRYVIRRRRRCSGRSWIRWQR